MKKFKLMLLLALILVIGGCSKTESVPSEIVVDSSSATEVEASESSSYQNPNVSSVAEEDKGAVITKIAVSEKNVFVSSEPEFIVDYENLLITLNVDYTSYIDIRSLKGLFLDIEVDRGTFELVGKLNGRGGIDLTEDAKLIVTDEEGEEKIFVFDVKRTVHDLPIVNIYLENLAPIDSVQRDIYSNMMMYIDCSGSDEFSDTGIMPGAIRGRGHSTWEMKKKPYRIKLNESASVLGMPKNRDWILLSNHADKSFIRNIVAYDMGRELGFVWTGTQYPVDVFINGVYRGVYALGEHREIAESRIALDESDDVDRGYLLELGGADEDDMIKGYDWFHSDSYLANYITFADPHADKLTDEQRQFVKDYINKAERAIVSGEGYEEYIDVQSFCDWIIIHELTCNLDSCFRRSCFMTKDKGGKLKMGPIWDFDLAFGNFDMDNLSYDTWFTVGSMEEDAYISVNWCNYLMENESFRGQLRARWFEVRDMLLDTAYASIDKNKAKISASANENFAVWDIWDKKIGAQSWLTFNVQSYDGQVKYIRDFLAKRARWIDENI